MRKEGVMFLVRWMNGEVRYCMVRRYVVINDERIISFVLRLDEERKKW